MAQPSSGFCEIDACCQNKTDEAGKRSCLSGYSHSYPSRNKYREENPRCGTNGTCSPSVCNCYANGVGKEDCAASFNDICKEVPDANGKIWKFEGCYRDYPDYPDFQLYYKAAYCGVTNCFVDGGKYGSCYCQMFNTLCELFGDVRKYSVSEMLQTLSLIRRYNLIPHFFAVETVRPHFSRLLHGRYML